ncbi:DarT ssDNA thymidine ADP-ribosyltransferase family protein [Malaciobacter sp. WC5094]
MRKYIRKNDIKTLVHFTNINNLDKILEKGLLSRKKLIRNRLDFDYNDESRYDGFLNTICCSITHPNYKMFYKLRIDNPNKEWVVIGIKSRVLYSLDCTFSHDNAASTSITTMNISDRKGLNGLKKMFSDKIKGYPKRKELNIPSNYPTNPQAEVLIRRKIPLSEISGVAFNSRKRQKEFKKKYPNIKMIYSPKYFSYRKDYDFWR